MTDDTLTIGQALERDHHAIDAHFARFSTSLANGPVDADSALAGIKALRHHIWVEETLHFPPLRAGGLMAPLMVMVSEHGKMWDLMDTLEEQVTDGGNPFSTWRSLAAAIQDHNAKEEQIVYPAGDKTLTQEVSDDARYALESEETPEGWTCQLAGRG